MKTEDILTAAVAGLGCDMKKKHKPNLKKMMADALNKLLADKRFDLIDYGRHRYVFLHLGKGYVIKLAKNIDGLQANDDEIRLSKQGDMFPTARCRRLSEVAIVMEYVHKISSDNYPYWVYSVDSCQVGINRKGELVAYDYSII